MAEIVQTAKNGRRIAGRFLSDEKTIYGAPSPHRQSRGSVRDPTHKLAVESMIPRRRRQHGRLDLPAGSYRDHVERIMAEAMFQTFDLPGEERFALPMPAVEPKEQAVYGEGHLGELARDLIEKTARVSGSGQPCGRRNGRARSGIVALWGRRRRSTAAPARDTTIPKIRRGALSVLSAAKGDHGDRRAPPIEQPKARRSPSSGSGGEEGECLLVVTLDETVFKSVNFPPRAHDNRKRIRMKRSGSGGSFSPPTPSGLEEKRRTMDARR
jgi:hypothetical protein